MCQQLRLKLLHASTERGEARAISTALEHCALAILPALPVHQQPQRWPNARSERVPAQLRQDGYHTQSEMDDSIDSCPVEASCSTTAKHLPRASTLEEGCRRRYPGPRQRQTTHIDVCLRRENTEEACLRAVPRAELVRSDALSMRARRWACEVSQSSAGPVCNPDSFDVRASELWMFAEGSPSAAVATPTSHSLPSAHD